MFLFFRITMYWSNKNDCNFLIHYIFWYQCGPKWYVAYDDREVTNE